ncbi:MAG: hypothetical protein KF754_16365 [Planctomycetes bacterium]|nr:hypothetical protein [Planctomycetota bacterium]
MSTESLRNELIAWIGKLDDQGLLKALLGLKKLLGQGGKSGLTTEERAAITARLSDKSLNDDERGFWTQVAGTGLLRAYDDHEPDISGITLLEPNPDYGK